MQKKIAVTGGAGFIGSHTVVALIESGHEPVVVDSLVNASRSVLERIEAITGVMPEFHLVDIRDSGAMKKIVDTGFEACIHFAALKAVGESVEDPLRYYDTNVGGTIALVQALLNAGVPTFVFSSSATVYGESDRLPLTEEMPMGSATNPYGWTKIFMERILQDVQTSNPAWSVALLRYFNPVGAHPSGLIGEDPQGVPSNLMPYVARVAEGTLAKVRVFGDDYPTPDGTGVRDYVHVVDIAAGHVTALEAHHRDPGVHTYNLGTGRGTSVLEVVAAYEKASGNAVPYEVVDRRPGDVAANWADVSKAKEILNWVASRDLATMCADSWNWIRHKG
jgi:UDP-glucose 4-epimerase